MEILVLVLLLVAALGIILGMIKPGIVIRWGSSKTRGKVLLTYGLVFVTGVVLAAVIAPSDIDAGKTALAQGDYNAAVTHLKAVKPSDPGYAEAQKLLPDATEKFAASKLKAAQAAEASGDHAKVISLLTDYPPGAVDSESASKMLAQAKNAAATAERERNEQAAQRAAQAQADKAQREAQAQADKAQREAQRQQEAESTLSHDKLLLASIETNAYGYYHTLILQSKVNDITIKSVKMNRGNCNAEKDYKGVLPAKLKFGDTLRLATCKSLIEASIVTDKGRQDFEWEQ